MKRIAAMILVAVFGSQVAAAELPLPTGMAPTSPSVPAPVLMGGLPAVEGGDWSRTSFRDRLGIGGATESPVMSEAAVAGPRLWNRMLSWRPCRECALLTAPVWCEPCAPAVRRPLPPLPAGLSTSNCATGACSSPEKPSGSCCAKLKDWLCFHYSPVRMPCTPTPKLPALYTYFPTQERAGLCATGHCATGGMARVGKAACCVPCPVPGEAIAPGFRLANPEVK